MDPFQQKVLSLQQKAGSAADINLEQAILYLQEDTRMITATGKKDSFATTALKEDYYHLAKYYQSQNRLAEMLKAVDNCIEICTNTGIIDPYLLYVLWIRTNYLFNIGDYAHCIRYADIGMQAAHHTVDTQLYYFNFLNFQINSQLQMGNFAVAEKLINDNLDSTLLIGKPYLLHMYSHLALLEIHKKNYSEAQKYFNKALEAEASQTKLFSVRYFQTVENIGYYIFYNVYKNGAKALDYYRKAQMYFERFKGRDAGYALELLNLYTNFANAWTLLNRYDSALRYYQLAFDQLGTGTNESRLMDSSLETLVKYDRVWYLTSLITDKGDAYLELYKKYGVNAQLAEAIRIYKAADRLQDRIKPQLAAIESKLFWSNDSRRLYEHAIEASWLAQDKADAFYFFEKSRAVMLNEQLNEQYLLKSNDILELSLLQRTNSSENLIRLDKLKQSIKEKYPLYFQSFLDTSFINPQDVRTKLLQPNQYLLELFEGDSAIYTMLVSAGDITLGKVQKVDFDSTVQQYMYFLSHSSQLNKDFNSYTKVSYHLYKLLFGNNPPPAGRLVISPDGPYFPFESMIINGNPSSPVYFFTDYAVSYTYSARFLLNTFNDRTSDNDYNFLGIAPVHFNDPNLVTLAGSDQSLDNIKSYFSDARNLVLENATKKNFLDQFSKYKIIQLYAHAADSSSHDEPVINFSDSALYLSDLIPSNRPSTQLIVLSACRTGSGKFYRGEGVFSFNRAFAALGIPSAVTNLWSVEDKATYKLTELFYKYVAKGEPLDIALQEAKKEFLLTNEDNELPGNWAASVLIGKTGGIPSKGSYPWKLLILILVGTLGLGVATWYFRKKLFHQSAPRP
jgi:tetratricopeptide (TPR) repeat protein